MKTRMDAIHDKLLAIEIRAKKAQHLPDTEGSELRRNIIIIGSLYNEVWAVLNTTNEQGKAWDWWD